MDFYCYRLFSIRIFCTLRVVCLLYLQVKQRKTFLINFIITKEQIL